MSVCARQSLVTVRLYPGLSWPPDIREYPWLSPADNGYGYPPYTVSARRVGYKTSAIGPLAAIAFWVMFLVQHDGSTAVFIFLCSAINPDSFDVIWIIDESGGSWGCYEKREKSGGFFPLNNAALWPRAEGVIRYPGSLLSLWKQKGIGRSGGRRWDHQEVEWSGAGVRFVVAHPRSLSSYSP